MNKIKSSGFTLVELLIAMSISLLLLFACTSVYSSLRNSINIAQGLSTAQESLRGAHYLMARSVRQGYGMVLSGANPTESEASTRHLIISYGEEANSNLFYGCLGERQISGATDTFFVKADSEGEKHLYCTTTGVLGDGQLIALDVKSLSASLATNPNKGVDVNLVIKGMPGREAGTMGKDGFTFSLAMRQRILIDAGISGASATSLSVNQN